MQAQAAESSGYAGQPPPLFELRRVRKRKGRAIAKRRRIPLLFGGKNLKAACFDSFYFNQALKQARSAWLRAF
jgi:hypothetical protein